MKAGRHTNRKVPIAANSATPNAYHMANLRQLDSVKLIGIIKNGLGLRQPHVHYKMALSILNMTDVLQAEPEV